MAVLVGVELVASLLQPSIKELQTGLDNRGIVCLPGIAMDYPSAQVSKSRGLNNALYADTQPQPFRAPRAMGELIRCPG